MQGKMSRTGAVADLLVFGIESAKKARRPNVEDPLRRFQGGNSLQAPVLATCFMAMVAGTNINDGLHVPCKRLC